MRKVSPEFTVEKDLMTLIREGLDKVGQHRIFLIILWALFNVPTNLFTYFRLEPYMNQAGSTRGDVMFMMILLSILGYIPMIAIALIIREEGSEYDRIILDAFKRIPLYITTSLVMILRLVLPVFVFYIPLTFLAMPLSSAGFSENQILVMTVPLFILIFLFFFMLYYSAPMFYLMRDIRNFRAVRYSSSLFRGNWKVMTLMLGICVVIPLLINYTALFMVDESLPYMIISLVVGAYMYVSNGIFANLFLNLRVKEEQ